MQGRISSMATQGAGRSKNTFFSFEFDLKKELSNKAFKDFMGTCCRIVFLSFFLSGSLGQDGSRKDGKSLVMQKIRILCSLMFS